jgi:hypothetical protein
METGGTGSTFGYRPLREVDSALSIQVRQRSKTFDDPGVRHYAMQLAKEWQREETTSWRFCRKSLSLSHAPDTARTCNLQFRRLSLYPVELRVLFTEPLTIGHKIILARGK